MERVPAREINERMMFLLPSSSGGLRRDVQHGFTPIDTVNRSLDFMPFDPVMSIINAFSDHGERIGDQAGYGDLVIRISNTNGIWDVNKPRNGLANAADLMDSARQKAADHLAMALARSRNIPLYIVMQNRSGALLAARLRSFTKTRVGIIPIVADIYDTQGRTPRTLTLAKKPLASRRAR